MTGHPKPAGTVRETENVPPARQLSHGHVTASGADVQRNLDVGQEGRKTIDGNTTRGRRGGPRRPLTGS